jgi:selenoprotein W-related protein
MKLEITFCLPCGHLPRVNQLVEQIFDTFKPIVGQPCIIEQVVIIPGSEGVFDVKLDGELIFSKKAIGRHAEEGEIIKLIKERM